MFDVSFSELFVIAVVALLVIGPEKLPKVARTMGAYMGRMQRYVAQVKEEINREVRFEELQKLQQEIKQTVEDKVVKPIQQETTALRASIHKASDDAKKKAPVKKEKITAKPATAKPNSKSQPKQKIAKQKTVKPKVAAK